MARRGVRPRAEAGRASTRRRSPRRPRPLCAAASTGGDAGAARRCRMHRPSRRATAAATGPSHRRHLRRMASGSRAAGGRALWTAGCASTPRACTACGKRRESKGRRCAAARTKPNSGTSVAKRNPRATLSHARLPPSHCGEPPLGPVHSCAAVHAVRGSRGPTGRMGHTAAVSADAGQSIRLNRPAVPPRVATACPPRAAADRACVGFGV